LVVFFLSLSFSQKLDETGEVKPEPKQGEEEDEFWWSNLQINELS
jgi:hypothetical protein